MTEFCQIKDPHYNFCSEDSHFKERKHQISSLQYSIYTVFRTKDVGLIPQNIRNCTLIVESKSLIKL